ncbi:MAG: CapA family protein [Pseudomonadota bacterium]
MNSIRSFAAGVLLAGLAACAGTPDIPAAGEAETAGTKTPPAAEPAPAAARPATPAPSLRDRRLRLALVGDMMIGTDYPENRLPEDPAGYLGHVAPVLSRADLAVGNLEGVLADGGEAAKQCSNPRACYLFRSPAAYAEHYRNAGFDLLSLANNHARDFGEEGRSSSMAALDAVGIRHSGREGEFASFEHDGLRIAFLAYAVTRNSNLLHDYERAELTVRMFAADHDIVIVSFHGGAEGPGASRLPFAEEEYYGEPRGDVVRFARAIVAAGADLVVGHGPHVIRAAERYEGRLIAYSLGNFATHWGISIKGNNGIAPILEVTLDGEGRFLAGNVVSTVQTRPHGPAIDPLQRSLIMLRELGRLDFGDPGLVFHDDGRIQAVPRKTLKKHP